MTRRRDDLLDHEADGIREFDNDLPRWWLYGFYVTIIFSVLYVVNFHVLPKPLFGAPSIAAEYEADVQQAAICGEAGHAQRMHVHGHRQVGIGGELGQALAVRDEELAEAHAVGDQVAHGEVGMLRLHDAPQGPAHHRHVQVLAGGQPGAHGRVDRHVEVLHQHLAVGGVGDLGLHQPEVGGGGHPLGTRHEVDFTADGHE